MCSTCYGRWEWEAKKDRYQAYQAAYRKRTPTYAKYGRQFHLKKTYGITPEGYADKLRTQDGKCAICRVTPSKKRHLCVDHNHATGVVRGLLCDKCNLGIEWLERPGWAHAAQAYLDSYIQIDRPKTGGIE